MTRSEAGSRSWVGPVLSALGLFALSAVVWFGGAVLVTTALLEGSRTMQVLFVNILATMQWSGTTIILMIGAALAVLSLGELLLWPQAWLWQRTQVLGQRAILGGWLGIVLIKSGVTAWGAVLWGRGLFLAVAGNAPEVLLYLAGGIVGALIALLPEWMLLRAIRRAQSVIG